MHLLELSLLLMLGAIVSVALAPRVKVPLEIFLLCGSLLVSLIPGTKPVMLDSEVVFSVFLPPILFYAAYFTSWSDFKRNIRPISFLAVGLVIFTTLVVAVVCHALIPGLPWPAAFLLGAIVSPPDASAATAITKKLGVPRRLITILEGESLINDATALVAYKVALAALLEEGFDMHQAWIRFLAVACGGALVGYVVARATLWLGLKLKDHSAEILNSFIAAFGAYVLAEHLEVSGVIATVTAGLVFGQLVPAMFPAETRVQGVATWGVVILAVNGFVFTLIGLQLPVVLSGLWEYSWGFLAMISLTVFLVVVVTRFWWVFPSAALPRLLSPEMAKNDPLPPWRTLVLLSWIGMRGIVSLAAALAIPAEAPAGVPFQYRSLMVFVAYSVVLLTLVIPTLTLAPLMRMLKIESDGEERREEVRVRVELAQAVVAALKNGDSIAPFDNEVVEGWRARYEAHLERIKPNLEDQAHSRLDSGEQQARRLALSLVEVERSELTKLRKAGTIHDETFHQISKELDFEELRLRTSTKATLFMQ